MLTQPEVWTGIQHGRIWIWTRPSTGHGDRSHELCLLFKCRGDGDEVRKCTDLRLYRPRECCISAVTDAARNWPRTEMNMHKWIFNLRPSGGRLNNVIYLFIYLNLFIYTYNNIHKQRGFSVEVNMRWSANYYGKDTERIRDVVIGLCRTASAAAAQLALRTSAAWQEGYVEDMTGALTNENLAKEKLMDAWARRSGS